VFGCERGVANVNTRSLETALITGASSGIGAAYARQLASRGYDLILVARREERLKALATELQQRYLIDVEVLVADLSNPTDVGRVQTRIAKLRTLGMLINNAGFGVGGRFAEFDLSRQIAMIQLHIVASIRLSRAVLPGMISRGKGIIINVSSLTALMPESVNATYAATKAYILTFSESLHSELIGTGVQVQVLLPGCTATEFWKNPDSVEFHHSRIPKLLWMSAEEVVTESLNALNGRRVICIPGLINRLIATLARSTLTSFLWKTLVMRMRRWLPELAPVRSLEPTRPHPTPALTGAIFEDRVKAAVMLGW
jgi:short-subunit dehydrogenase